jgi:spoIIIJ-associated protein
MRFEGRTKEEALEKAARELSRNAGEIRHRVIRDEKSFWGGRVVEIEVEDERAAAAPPLEAPPPERLEEPAHEPRPAERAGPPEGATDEEAWAAVESTLTELLAAAGFLVETRRHAGPEMLFELIGDDVEPLLANKGEGLSGLEVLAGRIASKRLGKPVYPRLDAEGFRAHQRESLEELAFKTAEEAKRTRRPQLLPPLAPGERRLVHLALAQDPDVETESEGDGFLKRVAVRPKAS